MNEPRVIESVTNECQLLGRAHESSSARAEQLIACLEGEIAKRDARIVELEDAAESLRISRDYHHEQEVEYRRRWAGLNAAPVSEAKAQGVVQWPEADEIMQMAFEEGQPADDASGYFFELEEFDLFIERLMSEVARLNAAPVQQVSVPDGKVCVPVEVLRLYEFMAASFTPFTSQHEQIAISLRKAKAAMLAAAPAAPAADAGGVLEQAMYTLISIGYHENSGLVHELRQALAARRSTGVV